jgi:hypothetical protein
LVVKTRLPPTSTQQTGAGPIELLVGAAVEIELFVGIASPG